ncbi:DNA mismatch repair protein MutL [Clostridia bacterium]|nr:DNA mismatch repair protein MutL [Clostridia bacterium]
MSKINVLDRSVYELIAAGEVIERPASVVKELIENSVDAAAKSITVEIRGGGIEYLRVTDDGCGIHCDDVPNAFVRHATSKVREAADLTSIYTLGFRGEALASVAAVARVEMLTKPRVTAAEPPGGTRYTITGGNAEEIEEAECAFGTSVIIRDIFYNTPARLKFLKKDVTEANYIAAVVEKAALANPNRAFKFIRDGKTALLTAGDGRLISAVRACLGSETADGLIPVSYNDSRLSLRGYISSPNRTRASRAAQNFFVNGRYIRSRVCTAALEEGYRGSIMVGKFPAAVINIDMPAADIDVNVHPAKVEVRFSDDRALFSLVNNAVKTAILAHDNRKDMGLQRGISGVGGSITGIGDSTVPPRVITLRGKTWGDDSTDGMPAPRSEREDKTQFAYMKEHLRENPAPPKYSALYLKIQAERQGLGITQDEQPPPQEYPPQNEHTQELPQTQPAFNFIGELFGTYLLCEQGGEFLLIDKHAADERIRFNSLKRELQSHSQLLAEAIHVPLSREQYAEIENFTDVLAEIGIEIMLVPATCTAEILSLPAELYARCAGADMLVTIAEILREGGGREEITAELYDDMLHMVACRAAIKAGDRNSDLRELAAAVIADNEVSFCPHGRPVVMRYSKHEIEKYFGRV